MTTDTDSFNEGMSEMVIFVQGRESKGRVASDADRYLGEFLVPTRICKPSGVAWAADNNAFVGFNEVQFRSMLVRIVRGVRCEGWPAPAFVTQPDVVASHTETMKLFGYWNRVMCLPEINRAFVLQDGAELLGWRAVPWDYCEALFIGGSTEFKLGTFAAEMAHRARLMGKWVHMGRVNSVRRALYAQRIGCHSIDGSGLNRFPDAKLEPVIRHLRQKMMNFPGTTLGCRRKTQT